MKNKNKVTLYLEEVNFKFLGKRRRQRVSADRRREYHNSSENTLMSIRTSLKVQKHDFGETF